MAARRQEGEAGGGARRFCRDLAARDCGRLLGEEGGLSARLELDETIKFEETCKENIAAERSVSESSREA